MLNTKFKKWNTQQTKRRQPRTAARRSYVRASVRAKLESAGLGARGGARVGARAGAELAAAAPGVQELASRRQRAGIPALSLFGNPHQIDYFSEDDERGVSESASTAVAVRPTASILSAYRQVLITTF